MTSPDAPAVFGPAIKTVKSGGTTISIELIPKRGETIISLSRKKDGELFFPTQPMHFGEDFDTAVRRILQAHIKCTLDSFYLATARSKVDGNAHWELSLVFVADIDNADPEKGFHTTEFTESTVPAGLIGWSESQLRAALER